MSTYQSMVTAIEEKVNETKKHNSLLLNLPEALKAKFVEVMQMPPEMCLVGVSNGGGFSTDLHPVDGRLEFEVAVKLPQHFGVEMFLIPIAAFVVGNSYRACVVGYSSVEIPTTPMIHEGNLGALAHHAGEYLRKRVKEFLVRSR